MENKFFRFKRLKAQTFLFAPVLFLIIALLGIFTLKADLPVVRKIRILLTEISTPAIAWIQTPIKWVKSATQSIGDVILVYRENEKLRLENIRLQAWQNTAEQLSFENEKLKKMLNYVPIKPISFITTQVMADSAGDFSKSKIIGAGKEQGIRKGDVVFTDKALIGHVIEVGGNFSRFLMLTDYYSRVPVMIPDKGIKGILTGDNTPLPKLILLPEEADVRPGDKLLTSGDSGVYPPGLPVGVVINVEPENITVRLNQAEEGFEFVRVGYYGLDDHLLHQDKDAD